MELFLKVCFKNFTFFFFFSYVIYLKNKAAPKQQQQQQQNDSSDNRQTGERKYQQNDSSDNRQTGERKQQCKEAWAASVLLSPIYWSISLSVSPRSGCMWYWQPCFHPFIGLSLSLSLSLSPRICQSVVLTALLSPIYRSISLSKILAVCGIDKIAFTHL